MFVLIVICPHTVQGKIRFEKITFMSVSIFLGLDVIHLFRQLNVEVTTFVTDV